MDLEKKRQLRNAAYNIAVKHLDNCIRKEDRDNLSMLLNQYNYGLEAKNDLMSFIMSMGWMKMGSIRLKDNEC